MTDLFEDKTQPLTVLIKHAELYTWNHRAHVGELHIQKMKSAPGGYELQILWLNGRKLNTLQPPWNGLADTCNKERSK